MAIRNYFILLLAAALATCVERATVPQNATTSSMELEQRAAADAPSNYIPTSVDCPSNDPTIRNGSILSKQERDWVMKRRNKTIEPIRGLLSRLAISGFNSDEYLRHVDNDPTALPNIGIAFSGGGYRAMLCGAGQLAALDSRSTGSDAEGHLGGILQSATYISGLSGSGWLLGSLYINNITTVEASLSSGDVWQFENSILKGPEQYGFLDYIRSVFHAVREKDNAGYEISITDYWGRMLSYQLINATDGGPGYTFSSIAEDEQFSSGAFPLPFLVAVGRKPNEEVISINSTVYEFSPWELGSSDHSISGYVPLRWVGSNFTDGMINRHGDCVRGFDNAGFVMGTSSSLFNQFVLYLKDPNSTYVPDAVPDFVIKELTSVLESIGDNNNDIADWTPNPFQGWNPGSNYIANEKRLTLVDGGEDLQNIPYHPLILNDRKVDVIISFDNSADTEMNWPDGASPIATYERSLEDISEGTSFPVVPGKNTFRNLGLNSRPAFFGCNGTNTTHVSPLIVYIPNYPYVYFSNRSTFQMTYNITERDALVQNGWAVATQLNATRDPDWPACVGCAILKRSFDRTKATIPEKCNSCFATYCWNGTLNENNPSSYSPDLYGKKADKESLGLRVIGNGFLVIVGASTMCAMLLL